MSLIKNSIIYTIFEVFQKGIGIFLLPLYIYFLTPTSYGFFGLVKSFIGFIGIFTGVFLTWAVIRFYSKYIEEEKKLRTVWGSSYILLWISSIVISLILFALYSIIDNFYFKGLEFLPTYLMTVLSITYHSSFLFYQSILQAKQEASKYGRNNIFYILSNLICTLISLFIFDLGLNGVIGSLLITNFIFSIISIFLIKEYIDFKIDFKLLKEALDYSLPMIPHSLSIVLMSTIDKYFINRYFNTHSVGIYNLGFQLGSIISLITGAISTAYTPWFFQEVKEGERGKQNIALASKIGISLLNLIGLSFSIFSYEIIKVITFFSPSADEYLQSVYLISYIAFMGVFNGIYIFVSAPLLIEKTKVFSLVSIFGAILNAFFNYLLIPRFQIVGAAIASLIQKVLTSLFFCILAKKDKTKIPFNFFYMYLLTFSTFILVKILDASLILKSGVFILFKILIIILYISFIYVIQERNVKEKILEKIHIANYIKNRL